MCQFRSSRFVNPAGTNLALWCTALAMCLAMLAGDRCQAQSSFVNEVSSNGDNTYLICNLCDIQAPISTRTPNTIFHPNPINGYGSIQGVDIGPQNGAGLTVNAAADLALGATFTKSKSTAWVEFSFEPLVIFNNDPVDVLLRGAYGFTEGGGVSAVLWRGFKNCEACSGTTRHTLLNSAFFDPTVGIWDATVELRPYTTYTLKLEASAIAFDLESVGLNASSRAFIDPVITTAAGEPLTINFDAGTLTSNPNFVSPDLIPEPSALALVATLTPALIWFRRLA